MDKLAYVYIDDYVGKYHYFLRSNNNNELDSPTYAKINAYHKDPWLSYLYTLQLKRYEILHLKKTYHLEIILFQNLLSTSLHMM